MKKILVTVDSIWPTCVDLQGIKNIYALQKLLAKEKFEIHILTAVEKWSAPEYKKWYRDQSKETGITFHLVDNSFKFLPRLYVFLIKFLFFIKAFLIGLRYRIDIIHEYSSFPFLINTTWLIGKLLSIKSIHTLCTDNTGWLSSPRFVFLKPNKIITTSNARSDSFKESQIEATYLPHGIDINAFLNSRGRKKYRAELNIPEKALVVLYLGLVSERKGVFTFSKIIPQVLKELPRTFFIIATNESRYELSGYLKKKKRLMRLIEPYSDNVRFIEGYQVVSDLMGSSDILLYPLKEGFGTLSTPAILIEALASALPIIASDIPINRGIIKHGENGILFQNDSDLVNLTIELLANKQRRLSLCKKASETANRYDLNLTAKRLKKIYLER